MGSECGVKGFLPNLDDRVVSFCEVGDSLENTGAGDLVACFSSAGVVILLWLDGLAKDDGYRGAESEGATFAEGLKGAKDSGWDHGHLGATGNEADAGLGLLQVSVRGAGAFGKEDQAFVILEGFEHAFDRAYILASITIDRDGANLVEPPRGKATFPQGLASEIRNLSGNLAADKRRVEKTGVIGGDEKGAVLGQIFQAGDFSPEKHPVDDRGEVVEEAVDGLHLNLLEGIAHAGESLVAMVSVILPIT